MRNVDVKALKKAMIEVDLDSNTKLSAATKIDKCTLTALVNGTRKPSYDTVIKLADALHLSYEEIGSIFFARESTAV